MSTYTRRVEEFDDWRFKMRHPLAGDAEILLCTSWVDNQVVHVSDDELDQFHHGTGLELFVGWLDPQLYHVLSAGLGGSALVVVKSLAEEKTRDINVWVEITKPFLLGRSWRRNCCYIFGTKVSRHVHQNLWQLRDVHAGTPVFSLSNLEYFLLIKGWDCLSLRYKLFSCTCSGTLQ